MSAKKVVGPDGYLYPEGTTFSDVPRHPSEIVSERNLSLWALRGQLTIERDEADPNTMTADKLAAKIPGMAAGVPFIGTVEIDPETGKEIMTAGYLYREEDEELLREERERYLAEHPEGESDGPTA